MAYAVLSSHVCHEVGVVGQDVVCGVQKRKGRSVCYSPRPIVVKSRHDRAILPRRERAKAPPQRRLGPPFEEDLRPLSSGSGKSRIEGRHSVKHALVRNNCW